MIFNGFSLAPVFVLQSGFPYNIATTGTAPNVAGVLPTLVRGGSGLSGSGAGNRIPLPFAGRNSQRFPKFWNFDLRVSRRFRFTETMNVEFLAEGFNLFNRTHILGNLDNTAYTVTAPATGTTISRLVFRPTYLTISPPIGETLYKARQFQFAIRFEF
jgi:hypothetical protein